MNEPRQMLGKLLGRHHREMVIAGEHCVACHQFSPTLADLRAAIEAGAGRAVQDGLDVDKLIEALHALHSIEFWKWWEPQPDGGAMVRSGTSPDFAAAIAAKYNALAAPPLHDPVGEGD